MTQLIINDEQDAMFDYELVHARYLEAFKDYFAKPFSVTGPWTLKARKDIISFIKAKDIVTMDLVYNLEPSVLTSYQIVLDEGVEKLVLTGTSIEVLPYEESFDIFVELHRNTRHADLDVMLEMIANKFHIYRTCLDIFMLHCNVCKKFRLNNMKVVTFNDRVIIEILKAPIQDIKCSFILFYRDIATEYMLFRPLATMDDYELSLELLKIFTDYGPPLVIESMHVSLLNSALMILERGGFRYDISINENNHIVINKCFLLMEEIVKRSNPDNTNWATTCRLVQYKYNSNQLILNNDVINKTPATIRPYQTLFRKKYSCKSNSESQRPENKDTLGESSTLKASKINESTIDSGSELNFENDEIMVCPESEVKFTFNTLHMSGDSNEDKSHVTDINVYSSTVFKTDVEEYNPIQIKNTTSSYVLEPEPTAECSDVLEIEEIHKEKEIKIEYDTINTCDQNAPVIPTSLNLYDIVSVEKAVMDIDENPITVGSDITNAVVLPNDMEDTTLKAEKATRTDFCTESKSKTMRIKIKDRYCSVCKGQMITHFYCFGCKKDTHIFCMARISNELKDISDTVTSFTYCNLCMKRNISDIPT